MSDASSSPAQVIPGDDLSTATTYTATDQENLNDDATLVSTIDLRSPVGQWTPRSRFMRFYNTPTFPAPTLEYVAGDPGADWAEFPQGRTNGSFFKTFLQNIISKFKSSFKRLGRMTFITASL